MEGLFTKEISCKLSCKELKEMCQICGQKTYGTKSDMIVRVKNRMKEYKEQKEEEESSKDTIVSL
jgi:hypothetical protein